MSEVPPRDVLTHDQHVALSNTICGDAQAVRELEQMGFVVIQEITVPKGREIAFYDLTEQGDRFVDQHYVIPTSR
jgi:hypothetical protein